MTFWITLGRALLAMMLGVAILLWPDKTKPLLGNFIGGFWIAGSLLSLRWGLAHEKSRVLTIVVAVVGALAGLAMSGRWVYDDLVQEDVLFVILGVVAALTGILHITGHLQVKKFTTTDRTRSGALLGIFEIVLGLILIFTEFEERAILNYVGAAWALVGGMVIFFDALAMRREEKEATEADAATESLP